MQVSEDDTLIEIILELIKHFNYFSREKVNKLLLDFYNQINYKLALDKDRTIYSKIKNVDQSKLDSSNTILEEFKICNNISNYFAHNLSDLSETQLSEVENVVIFDDIIGSGDTLIGFLTQQKQKLLATKVKLYVFCFVILEDALNYVTEFINYNKLNVEIGVCQ